MRYALLTRLRADLFATNLKCSTCSFSVREAFSTCASHPRACAFSFSLSSLSLSLSVTRYSYSTLSCSLSTQPAHPSCLPDTQAHHITHPRHHTAARAHGLFEGSPMSSSAASARTTTRMSWSDRRSRSHTCALLSAPHASSLLRTKHGNLG